MKAPGSLVLHSCVCLFFLEQVESVLSRKEIHEVSLCISDIAWEIILKTVYDIYGFLTLILSRLHLNMGPAVIVLVCTMFTVSCIVFCICIFHLCVTGF